MAKKVTVKLNGPGVRDLLMSPGVVDAMEGEGKKVAAKAGLGYSATVGSAGKTRKRVFVETTDWDSYNDNARNATLLRALGGG